MIELVITILIVGILAIAVVPRFFAVETFQSRGFYDETLSILRYANKTAVAQRRAVYAKLDTASGQVSLCFANHATAACTSQVPRPTGETSYAINAPSGVTLALSPAPANNTLFFDALGKPFASNDSVPLDSSYPSTFSTLTITLTGGGDTRTIKVEQETGYAH